MKISRYMLFVVAAGFMFGERTANADDRNLYWSEVNTQAISIQKIGLDSLEVDEVLSVPQREIAQARTWSRFLDLTTDDLNGNLYVNRLVYSRKAISNTAVGNITLSHVIERIDKAGKSRRLIYTPLKSIKGSSVLRYFNDIPRAGIAVDPLTRTILWSDIFGKSIWRVGYNGKLARQLVAGWKNIKGIAVEITPTHRYLYWAENSSNNAPGNVARIYRMPVAGGKIQRVLSVSDEIIHGLGLNRRTKPTALYYSASDRGAENSDPGTATVTQFSLKGAGDTLLSSFESVGQYRSALADISADAPKREVYWTYDTSDYSVREDNIFSIFKFNTRTGPTSSNPSVLISRTVPVRGTALGEDKKK